MAEAPQKQEHEVTYLVGLQTMEDFLSQPDQQEQKTPEPQEQPDKK